MGISQHIFNMVYLCIMQEGSRQAESNLKFLHVLKDPCADLADAKPADIPNMLPKILNLIRMIWVNSEFYKTRERLTGLLRKVIHWPVYTTIYYNHDQCSVCL